MAVLQTAENLKWKISISFHIRSIAYFRTKPKRPETSQKESKPAEMTQNQLKRPKIIAKQPKTTQNFKIGKIWNFLLAFVFQTLCPNAQIWVFWAKKYQISKILKKFCLYFILRVLLSNLTLFFKISNPTG